MAYPEWWVRGPSGVNRRAWGISGLPADTVMLATKGKVAICFLDKLLLESQGRAVKGMLLRDDSN